MMETSAAAVFKGPGPPAPPRSRLKHRDYGQGQQLLGPTTLFRMFHILLSVCVIFGAHLTAAESLQSSTGTTISSDASIEVPCLPTIALDASSTPLAVIPERSGSNKVSKSTSNPDIFPSSMNNNNNNNNDSNQHTKANPAQIIPKIPKNFSWVVDGFLAALGFPNEAANMMYLVKHGIKYLISLTAELTPSLQGFEDKLVWSQIKIKDFSPPTLQQVDEFLKVVEKARSENSAVAVHCLMGRGRTGCMLACYFVKEWELPAEDALRYVRELRPGSIQTRVQADVVRKFEENFKGARGIT
ncbi:specificity phosphatase 23 [Octopus vulgaris]|uniref:Specificity phosphatase 23 n=2 Tax=Octopus TaxID=6643 RepID=A0AA36BDG7_OCTVU|nr:dual specificity protein phosphatase CDC14B isoform X2 [Octopus sinensis]CAI9731652.1 specificity phosphatase 23 [Octopus vulgaris]